MLRLKNSLKMNIASFAVVMLAALLSFTTSAEQQRQPVEGDDYIVVGGISEAQSPMVREFFSYNCSHCYRQDATIEAAIHQLGKDVSFERTPIGAGRKTWIMSQEAYYLAEKFRVTNQVHGNIFKRIHEQGIAFSRPQQLKDFFVKQGVASEEVDAAISSIDLKLALRNYDAQAQLAQIRGVPAILINGKYLLKAKSRTPEQLAELIRYLKDK